MPELKNTFLEGKMNKDLDARLLKNGEYIDANNIHITKSEGSDVGAVQNILGNKLPYATAADKGTVIGYFANSERTTNILGENVYSIFYFVKGNSEYSDNIYYYEAGTTTAPIPLIDNASNFLNFNTDYLITGVNLIDDLLFWTDNLNQPRKINIKTALNNDNRTGTSARTGWYEPTPSYYNTEDKISAVKYYPYTAPKVLRQVSGTDHCGIQKLKTQATLNGAASTKTFDIVESSDTNHEIHVGQEIYHNTAFLGIVESISADGLTVTSDQVINKPDATVLTFLNQNNILEEKFVRFAYRFKFKDGEYSLISPFTQHCFIPKTYNPTYDGHDSQGIGLTGAQETEAGESTELISFINDAAHVNLQIAFPSSSPTTDFEIDKIEILIKESNRPDVRSLAQLNITDDSIGNDKIYNYIYKGTLPYKTLPEQQVTRVYDNVPVKAKAQEIIGNRLVYGNYQENPNNKPYEKVLDTNGNIDLASSYSFDYEVSVSDKNDTQKFSTQYPYSTIKTRRTYQIGVVLVDRYGRQSPVFLSDNIEKSIIKVKAKSSSETSSGWAGEALRIKFNKRIPSSDINGNSVLYSATNPTGWYTYKIVVKQNEQDYYNIYAPRVYDNFPSANTLLPGQPSSTFTHNDTDKRTWIVLHGDNINKVPRDTAEISTENNSIFPSNTSIFPKIVGSGDIMSDGPLLDIISIGKALDHGLEDATFDSNQIIWTGVSYSFIHNKSKNPLLAELVDGYGADATFSSQVNLPYFSYSTATHNAPFTVWETKPFESALDIYYETLTCGIISELNTEILADPNESAQPTSIKFSDNSTTADLPESLQSGNVVGSTHFETFDQNGTEITSGLTYSVISVKKDGLSLDTAGNLYFDIQDAGNNQYQLKTTSNFAYFGTSSDTYIVRIRVVNGSNQSTEQDFSIFVTNSTPIITVPSTASHVHFNSSALSIFQATAVNGSADTNQNTLNLTFSITGVTFDPDGTPDSSNTQLNKFTINSANGRVGVAGHNFPASEVGKKYRITVQVNDGSGQNNNVSSGSCDVTIGGWLWGNFRYSTGFNGICPAYCGNTSPQVFYVKRPTTNTSSSLTIQYNDLIYTDASLSTPFNHGYIITQLVGGDDGTGLNQEVTSGAISSIDNNNLCQNHQC